MEFLNGTDRTDRFWTWSQVKSPRPCFRFANKDVTRWFCSRSRPQERFPLNEMAIRDKKKKKEKRKRKLFPWRKRALRSNRLLRLHLTIELSRIWIELSDRSLEKNLCFFVKDEELLDRDLRFRNVGLGLEKNTDSRDNRHDRYEFRVSRKLRAIIVKNSRMKKQQKCFTNNATRDKSVRTLTRKFKLTKTKFSFW